MKEQHVLTDHMISRSQEMFLKGHHWIAYNSAKYELSKNDLEFFQNKQQATDFGVNNASEVESYKIIYASSIMDLIRQVSYGNTISENKINHA